MYTLVELGVIMKKYYGEQLNPKNEFRSQYENSLTAFVDEKLVRAEKNRREYMTPFAYKQNPQAFYQEFVKQMGFPLNTPLQAPKLISKTLWTTDGNVNVYRVQLQLLGSIKFYGLYFEQTFDKEQAPFIIACHGKEGTPELCSSIYMDSSNYNHMVRRATDRGANVFVPQTLTWSENFYEEPYDRLSLDSKLRQLGGSITALEVACLSCSITYFIENENVNADKIGALGLSYGGMFTTYLTAFDKRVKGAFACSWFNSTNVLSRFPDWCHFNGANTFGVGEISALICPRPFAVAMGDKDQIFDSKLTLKEGERVKEFYREFGLDKNFLCYEFDGYHEFDKGDTGLDFLFKHIG